MPLLAHDVQYAFDGAVELGYMSSDIATFFRYYHPDPNGWHDRCDARPRVIESDHAGQASQVGMFPGRFEDRAEAEYLKHRPRLTPRQRAVCSMEGLLGMSYHCEEMARHVAGAMLHPIPDGGLTKRVRRHLVAPAAIRRFVKRDRLCDRWRTKCKALIRRGREDLGSVPRDKYDNVRAWIDEERAGQRALHEELQERIRAQIGSGPVSHGEYEAAYERAIGTRRLLDRKRHKALRGRRRAAWKGYQLLSRLVSPETARMFLGGDCVTIEGQRFTFHIKKQHRASTMGHAGLQIELAERGGKVLSNLCLYWQDTPAIDQVAAIAMHVAAGEEDELIETGNLYACREGYRECAHLMQLKPQHLTPPEAQWVPIPAVAGATGGMVFALDSATATGSATITFDGTAVTGATNTFWRGPRDEAVRLQLRHTIVPIAERIVLELIDPHLIQFAAARKAERDKDRAALMARMQADIDREALAA